MVTMIISEADNDPTGRTGIGVDHKTTWTIGICCVELAAETARAQGSACGRNHHPLLGDHPQSDEPLEVERIKGIQIMGEGHHRLWRDSGEVLVRKRTWLKPLACTPVAYPCLNSWNIWKDHFQTSSMLGYHPRPAKRQDMNSNSRGHFCQAGSKSMDTAVTCFVLVVASLFESSKWFCNRSWHLATQLQYVAVLFILHLDKQAGKTPESHQYLYSQESSLATRKPGRLLGCGWGCAIPVGRDTISKGSSYQVSYDIICCYNPQ